MEHIISRKSYKLAETKLCRQFLIKTEHFFLLICISMVGSASNILDQGFKDPDPLSVVLIGATGRCVHLSGMTGVTSEDVSERRMGQRMPEGGEEPPSGGKVDTAVFTALLQQVKPLYCFFEFRPPFSFISTRNVIKTRLFKTNFLCCGCRSISVILITL